MVIGAAPPTVVSVGLGALEGGGGGGGGGGVDDGCCCSTAG